MTGAVLTLDQVPPRVDLYSSTEFVSCTGQERRMRFVESRWTERTGNGRTVVTRVTVLLAGVGSELPLTACATLVMVPAA